MNEAMFVRHKHNQPIKIEIETFQERKRQRPLLDVDDFIEAVKKALPFHLGIFDANQLTLHTGVETPSLAPELLLSTLTTGFTAKTALVIKAPQTTNLKFSDLLHTVPTSCTKYRYTRTSTSPKDSVPTYPRAAKEFTVWETFEKQVHEFSESQISPYMLMPSNFRDGHAEVMQMAKEASCERDIESSLELSTFEFLKDLVGMMMGVGSAFRRGMGDVTIVLQPDYLWKVFEESNGCGIYGQVCLPIEVKRFWLFPENINLASQYHLDYEESQKKAAGGNDSNEALSATILAVNQMFAYSLFNNCRYAALTTQHEVHFFKRSDTTGAVEISDPIPLRGIYYETNHLSFFTCWLFLLWNARENGIYTQPVCITPLKPINTPIQNLYDFREIKADQIHFALDLKIGKGAVGTVVSGNLMNASGLKFKLYDVYHDPNYIRISANEVATYKLLEGLQGTVIPKFYGYFNYHGILIIALEDCGHPLTVEEYPLFESRVNSCVAELLTFGVKHQDLEDRDNMYPNILKFGDDIRIIDFHL
ncbi:hypothetical protein BDR26DRAFT_874229 [Obelidium mucronatum]|nr:hypothetical protein BDR26DRAFT_874229 [Obelidium mucronatum]